MSDSNSYDSVGIKNIMSKIHESLTQLDEMTQSAQHNPELRKEIQDFRTNVLEQYLDRLKRNSHVPGERATAQAASELTETVLPEDGSHEAEHLDEAFSDYSPDGGTDGNVLC